ncbi:hypothetical protein CI238_10395 [Colletotrichum incanum]|uniref:Uncharacterized protein n=1 Tax=Colletotrichum incanum TaxID=1573173 RepID=A0A162PKY4_COLIC|nr:hypothetical protein CI238_10395 [Colletotrichum incanum]OHW96081.1 hypothetical protein CSPAE12_05231 [Colletotrichum incanum]
MAYGEPSPITDPSQVEEVDLSVRLSNLFVEMTGSESQSQLPTRHIKLVLLQPLATPAMLAICRNPSSALSSMTIDSGDGNMTTAPGNEYLNLTALDKAWRKAVGKVLPVSFITFDLSLPKPESSVEKGGLDAFQSIHWEVSPPYQSMDPCIMTRDVMRLVITIATTARMRTQGDLGFDIIYEEKDKASRSAMRLLQKQLQAIAESRRPGSSDGQQAVGSHATSSVAAKGDD